MKVGCADCTILELGNKCVVIDCGYRLKRKTSLRPFNFRFYFTNILKRNVIDLLIVTHPHHDHFIALQDVIKHVAIKKFWGSPYQRKKGDNSLSIEEWREYIALKEKLIPDRTKRKICFKGAQTDINGCTFKILGPRKDINDYSERECHDANLVIQIQTPLEDIVICGDASSKELGYVDSDWNLGSCSILKASHHGSINGFNMDFLKNVQPREIVISTASGLFSNLPNPTAMRYYRSGCKKLIRTDYNGSYKVQLAPILRPPPPPCCSILT